MNTPRLDAQPLQLSRSRPLRSPPSLFSRSAFAFIAVQLRARAFMFALLSFVTFVFSILPPRILFSRPWAAARLGPLERGSPSAFPANSV